MDPAVREAVRSLLVDADEAWEREDYGTAFDLFSRAYEVVGAPTIAIRRAECLEKLGRWVEAMEFYIVTSQLQLDPAASEPFRIAVVAAQKRVDDLRGRLAMLVVVIDGDDVGGAEVSVDGRVIPAALAAGSFPVDPGQRVVSVRKDKRRVSQTVLIADKEATSVTLVLPPAVSDRVPEAISLSERGAVRTGSTQRLFGWASMGVGVAGVAVGASAGLVAMGRRSSILDTTYRKEGEEVPRCEGNICVGAKPDVDGYNRLRTVSTVGFVVGIVGVGAGLTLLLTATEANTRDVAVVRPWLGVGSVGVEGAFR